MMTMTTKEVEMTRVGEDDEDDNDNAIDFDSKDEDRNLVDTRSRMRLI